MTVTVIVVSVCFCLRPLVHYEKNDYLKINEISYFHNQDDELLEESKDWMYTTTDEVKKMEKKIRKIPFIVSKKNIILPESPTSQILIKYKNGDQKTVNMVAWMVHITVQNAEGNILSNESYYVLPQIVRWILGC